jgi:Ser-tRNA(Ala) deacylase AlaX
MTELLYMQDCYLKEFDAKVVSVTGLEVELDKTAFYPTGGGQPCDKGKIVFDGGEFLVEDVYKKEGKVLHKVDKEGIQAGASVHCIIDWERRYRLMRMHTAAHIISEAINKETGALITGNQLDVNVSRIDYSLEDFDRERIQHCIEIANEIAEKGLEIKIYFLKREDALKIPKITKLAKGLPPAIENVRIVEIGDFDLQADGGTHVKNTREIGKIELVKMENKGKNNRRIYYAIKDKE